MPARDSSETNALLAQIAKLLPNANVEATAASVEKLQRPYNEMFHLCEALSEVVDPESLGAWFVTPNASFSTLKPIEVIERGETDRLWEMVFRLRSGMPG